MMRNSIKYLLLLVVIIPISFCAFLLYETQDEINATKANIDDLLARIHDPQTMAGFAVSVFSMDSVIYSAGFGYQDIDEKINFTPETPMYIASVSKTIIGVAILKAQEMGLLSMNEDLNRILPFEFRNPLHPELPITLNHLATHTSSLDYNEAVVESLYAANADKEKSLEPFFTDYFIRGNYGTVAFTAQKPGENWNYSNIGAGLAAYALELRSGMSFAEFTKRYLFDAIGTPNVGWYEKEVGSIPPARYYEAKEGGLHQLPSNGVKLYPCRDLFINLNNLTTLGQALIKNDQALLNLQSFHRLLSPQLSSKLSGLESDNHGTFFVIDRNDYGITYQLTGATGGDTGINTMFYLDLSTKLGYIFMGNTGWSEASRSEHIRICRALVSLGNDYALTNSNWSGRVAHRWHDYTERILAFF